MAIDIDGTQEIDARLTRSPAADVVVALNAMSEATQANHQAWMDFQTAASTQLEDIHNLLNGLAARIAVLRRCGPPTEIGDMHVIDDRPRRRPSEGGFADYIEQLEQWLRNLYAAMQRATEGITGSTTASAQNRGETLNQIQLVNDGITELAAAVRTAESQVNCTGAGTTRHVLLNGTEGQPWHLLMVYWIMTPI